MSGLSFRKFVTTRRPTYTSIGRYLEASKADPGFLAIATRPELEIYLTGKGALPSERDLASGIWRQYEQKVQKLGRG
jgi:hypothetical protein